MAPKSPTVRTTRRRLRALDASDVATISPTALDEHLPSLASLLEERVAASRDESPQIVRVMANGITPDGIDVGLRPIDELDDSVVSALTCFNAPTDWLAIGVATGGNAYPVDAYPVDERARAPRRVRVVHLVTRRGTSASVVRFSGETTALEATDADAIAGRVDDVCRRALGLPTPPPSSTLELWALTWLDRIVVCGTAGAPTTWETTAALHPAAAALVESVPARTAEAVAVLERLGRLLAEIHDWPALRMACGAGRWHVDGVTPAAARWLDDGAFSRWVLGSYPPLDRLADAACELLAPSVADRLRTVLQAWDVGT